MPLPREQETILVTELLQLIEERNYLVNLEETQRLTANEVDRQFREVSQAQPCNYSSMV